MKPICEWKILPLIMNHWLRASLLNVEYFRTIGVATMENLGKTRVLMVKEKHLSDLFSILHSVAPPKTVSRNLLKFNGIPSNLVSEPVLIHCLKVSELVRYSRGQN